MAGREFLPGDARQRERAYSPAIKVSGGTTIYLAGYGAFQDQAGKSYAGDFDAQVRLSFERIRQTLEKAGGKLPGAHHPWRAAQCESQGKRRSGQL